MSFFQKSARSSGGPSVKRTLDKLKERIHQMDIPEKDVWWYLETRKYGTAPHSGFGLGFERLVLFVTGMSNIRDVIPFPRTQRMLNSERRIKFSIKPYYLFQ